MSQLKIELASLVQIELASLVYFSEHCVHCTIATTVVNLNMLTFISGPLRVVSSSMASFGMPNNMFGRCSTATRGNS